jgi:hypothetical protein
MKEELNDDAIETVTLEEEQLAKMDDFFSDLPSEYSIVITREEPREYKGFLDEFLVDDLDKPLSIRDLIQKWGGKVLKILIRAPGGKFVRRFIIPLRSYEPLTNGMPCGRPYPSTAEMARNAPNDYLELLKAVQGTIKEIAPKQPAQTTQQGDSTSQMLIQLLVPMMTAAMQNMTRPTPQTSMSELMGMMVKMKDFLGDSPGNGDADQVLPGILKIGEALVTQRGTPQAQEPNPNRNRLTPPRITTIPNPNPAHLSIAPVPAPNPAPAPESDKIPIDKLPDFVGSLPPDVLSGLMIEVLSRMDENKREALTDQLLSALGIEAEEIEAEDSKSISAVNRTPPGQGE